MSPTTTEDVLYVNKPGGVIVHMADGSQETLGYGAPVYVDQLADHQKPFVSGFADSTRKSTSPAEEEVRARLKDAHTNAMLSNLGQPNSSADVVPGDYGQLDEDGAIALMRALEAYPAAQAQVVLHERVNYNRERVLDAATAQAREIADQLLAQTEDQVLAQHHVTPGEPLHEEEPVDPDDLDKAKRPALVKTAKDLGLNAGGSADDLRDRIKAHLAAAPGGTGPTGQTTPPGGAGGSTPPPQTPPPSSAGGND